MAESLVQCLTLNTGYCGAGPREEEEKPTVPPLGGLPPFEGDATRPDYEAELCLSLEGHSTLMVPRRAPVPTFPQRLGQRPQRTG